MHEILYEVLKSTPRGTVRLLEQVKEVAEMGIEDQLDPGCVGVFKDARQTAEELQQSIKAELAVHIAKGKWG